LCLMIVWVNIAILDIPSHAQHLAGINP